MIAEELREVEISEIAVNPYQPRRQFAKEELLELAASITTVGLIHPPTVRPRENGEGYEIISGERRYRAAQLAGMRKIPVIIRYVNAELSAQAALIENIQRVDLNPMEVAKALKALSEQLDLNQEELALRVGKKRSTVANYMRLLTLPRKIQESVEQGKLSMGHAKAILSVVGEEQQNQLHDSVLRDGWNVRQTEEMAQGKSMSAKAASERSALPRDIHLDRLAEKLQEKLGTRVLFQGAGKQGRVCIDYYSLDDLDRLLHILGVRDSC